MYNIFEQQVHYRVARRASSRRAFIKVWFKFFSSLLSMPTQRESGGNSNRSGKMISAAPSTFFTTAKQTKSCWSIYR